MRGDRLQQAFLREGLGQVLVRSHHAATRAISRDPDTRTIPIILCTSKSQETDKIWGLRQGARDYVVKPVDRDELLDKINALA